MKFTLLLENVYKAISKDMGALSHRPNTERQAEMNCIFT